MRCTHACGISPFSRLQQVVNGCLALNPLFHAVWESCEVQALRTYVQLEEMLSRLCLLTVCLSPKLLVQIPKHDLNGFRVNNKSSGIWHAQILMCLEYCIPLIPVYL
jgi:hypothetical protein